MERGCEDRLSSLADELLLKILSMTKSYKSSVACSVLSKRWSSLYSRLPHLYIDEEEFQHVDDGGPPPPAPSPTRKSQLQIWELEEEKRKHKNKEEFIKHVINAISAHRGNVESLNMRLSTSDFCKWWVCFCALSNKFKELSVDATYGRFPLPPCVFSCTNLSKLSLSGMKPPSYIPKSFSGFPCLVTLNISSQSHYIKQLMEGIICKCPCLEDLNLSFLWTYDMLDRNPLKISLPNLKHLEITARCPSSSFKVLVAAPRLLAVTVPPHIMALTCREFESIHGVKHAKWNDQALLETLEFQTQSCSPETAAWDMKAMSGCCALKKLTLMDMTLRLSDLWSMLSKLNNLQDLTLAYCYIQDADDGEHALDDYQLINLKEVTLQLPGRGDPLGNEVLQLFIHKTPFFQKLDFSTKYLDEHDVETYVKAFREVSRPKCRYLLLDVNRAIKTIKACVSKEP